MRRILPALAILVAGGCGYIGSPHPPLVNIPSRITDLDVVEHASDIIVRFTVPQNTTEGNLLRAPIKLDVRAGAAGSDWDERAKPLTDIAIRDGRAQTEFPAESWIGREVTVGARVIGANGKEAAWATYSLRIAPPAEKPAGLKAEATAQGVHLSWDGAAGSFRIFRRTGEEKDFSPVAEVDRREWTDTNSQFGQSYAYRVQRIVKADERHEAQSDFSDVFEITPRDTFPPAVPSGLAASAAPASIELTWEQNTEADLAAYRVYRAVDGGEFERIAEVSQIPAFSDQKVERGKTYRYAVTALDRAGNESQKSTVVEAVIP